MTLEQLRIFIAVAEREHVTQASRDLNLTQSATSAAVSTLEDRHQAKLFDRIGRRIVLTGVTTRKWRICPTFKNVSGTQVGLTV
ncbi:helix-turn-helix domain-containing protein, partial [Agrobacterium tumefaciens]|uniref:helix-turn-helix domain-containing protein n=1 Tax=Agrobacterium tumefaciens TaxID=358 RepID=UPI000554CFEA